jgi:SpoVK/Ycf46/Vps4 family AAA+-type ATPase
MTTTKKLAQLFRALAAEEIGDATTIAAQICQDETKKGHRSAARVLRGALQVNGTLSSHSLRNGSGAPHAPGMMLSGLVRMPTDVRLRDVVLTLPARHELEAVALEWKHRNRLDRRGIAPRSKLILHGPPGCGKSLTARALGAELGLPVYVVRFDAVIGAYLGQTAIHLRQLFHFAELNPCILLLDELDALGKRRGNPLDVGELDRIVISLMQELEHSKPKGLIVGTSNLPKHLDDALWRRFDLALELKRPSAAALSKFAQAVARSKGLKLPPMALRKASKAKSFADAEAIVIAEARTQILRGS